MKHGPRTAEHGPSTGDRKPGTGDRKPGTENQRPRTKCAWHPALGAWREGEATRFRVWAPTRERVDVVVEGPGSTGAVYPLDKGADGMFSGAVAGVRAGDLYRYRLDGSEMYPDPASRFQPDGVHGPSQVVDPGRFAWADTNWAGIGLDDLILYELHVGTFTPAGTFAGVTERLPSLQDLGVTAIELMPVADFPGQRNWGYDGVALFAPARCYGTPDDLRRLVDVAHRLGMAVLLDVVYNHLGPDGAYLGTFSPYYFSEHHRTPWGAAINLDGAHSRMVREFFIENACHWIHEYHFDGLRLDATHALIDDSPRHFLAELTSRVRASVSRTIPRTQNPEPRTHILLIAEDSRNLAHTLRPEEEGGWGLDAVWADDFHHQVRGGLAGDRDGYYRDFTGSAADLATTVRTGWFFCGQPSTHLQKPRGTDPTGLAPRKFLICLQNHDQVGNRAFGERLHHQIDLAAYRAATVLLLCAPETPLLFMGQEWAASTPFLFFTDHNPELGKLVTEGRRREFKHFSAFADPRARERIPDPQAPTTFQRSRLIWSESEQEPHASMRRLYCALLRLRRSEPALQSTRWDGVGVVAVGDSALMLHRAAPDAARLVAVIRLHGAGSVTLTEPETRDQRPETQDQGPATADRKLRTAERGPGTQKGWELVLGTEDPPFTASPTPPRLDLSSAAPVVHFSRPGAVILRSRATAMT